MLNDAVKNLKEDGNPSEDYETEIDIDVDAFIPSTYIKNEMQKLELYKRIAMIANHEEYSDMQEELTDRFGDIPTSVENLLRIALLKAEAHEVFVTSLEHKGGEIRFVLFPRARLQVEKITDFMQIYGKRMKFTPGGAPFFIYKLKTGEAAVGDNKKKTPVELLFAQNMRISAEKLSDRGGG